MVGVRILGVRPGSVLSALGIENGDRLTNINGYDVADPQRALEAYGKIRNAENIVVAVNRSGKAMSLDIQIK